MKQVNNFSLKPHKILNLGNGTKIFINDDTCTAVKISSDKGFLETKQVGYQKYKNIISKLNERKQSCC